MRRIYWVALAVVLLTACQGDAPSIPRSWAWPDLWPWGEAAPVPTPLPPITILGPAGNQAANQHLQERIAAFERAAPQTPISGALTPDYATALEDAFAAGAPPDLFVAWSHELAALAADDAILPIPAAYDQAPGLPAHLRPALQVGGVTYCIPRDFSTLALFYNPALFDRAEAPYPTPTWSWDDLRRSAEAVTDAGFGIYGLVLAADASRLLPLLAAGDQDGDPWRGPDAAAGLESYVNLFATGFGVAPVVLDSSWAGEAFGRGRAAMTLEANWLLPYLAVEFPELEYGVVEVPLGANRRSTVLFASCWVVSRQAADPQGALELAAFLTTPEANRAWAAASGALPPSLEQARAWLPEHPAFAPFAAGLDYAIPWTGDADFVSTMNSVNSLLAGAFAGEATAADVLERLATPGAPATPTAAQPAPED